MKEPPRPDADYITVPGTADNEMAKKIRPLKAAAMDLPKQKYSDSPLQHRLAEIQTPRPRA